MNENDLALSIWRIFKDDGAGEIKDFQVFLQGYK
jgi:hypothetical protein